MARLSLVPFTTDEAFYGALKVHVFGTVYDTVLQGLRSGNTRPLTLNADGLSVKIGRFTARKANNLFVPSGAKADSSAEFFGFTSHKVREKLSEMAEEGVVELVGKGLRDAQTYLWNEPIEKYQLCSYLRFRRETGGDTSLGLETYRCMLTFGEERFTAREFIEMYQVVHEDEYSQSRWGKRKFEEISESYQYQTFLKNRLKAMGKAGLLDANEEDRTFQLTTSAMEAGHHVGLFLEDVPYKASWEMCRSCPARVQCWDLQVTDLALDALAGGTNGATGGVNGGTGQGPVTNGSNGA